MSAYAQTNIQLFNQLRDSGYSSAELIGIQKSYELAMQLFTGRFQASGKPFLAHVVGTASILNSLRLPAQIVAAGLIHSIYRNGEFGDGRSGMTNSRRDQVRQAVGHEIEKYAARFATLEWGPERLSAISANLSEFAEIDRQIVMIHLADHLEHQLDHEFLYHRNEARRAYMTPYRSIMTAMAEELGLSSLAAELKRAYAENDSAEILPELRGGSRALLVPPKSYRVRSTLRVLNCIRFAAGCLVRRLV